ncbi:MAG: hypothetical protein EHM44_04870 [Ignavibacteriales bacterium]|jgi:hypothetical protein|nr:MAG: hypothetical protein EHM44_04870 [Ignavibacteriales bacterium]
MEVKEIFDKTLNSNYLIIEEDDLKSVLDNSEIIRVEDTYLSDFIRVLNYDEKLFVQETSFKKEILIRKMDSMKDVDFFVQERLDYYERKWDGCGCKIDYYE